MLGQLDAEVENPRTYMEWKEAALEKVQQLLGAEIMIKHKQGQIKWTVVADLTTELGTEEDRGFTWCYEF